MEDHVTSLSVSKKLKDAGIPQESLFYWVHFIGDSLGNGACNIVVHKDDKSIPDLSCERIASAFLATELLLRG